MRFLKTICGFAATLGLSLTLQISTAGAYDPETIRVALLPAENASMVIQIHQALIGHLEEHVGREIELVVTTDYSSMIEAMRFGRLDLAYFGLVSYILAKDRMRGGELDITPFAAFVSGGASSYQAVLIANAATPIRSIQDIKGSGAEMAFGDQASTSGHFVTKLMLMRSDVLPGRDYRENFTGAHDAVAKSIERGNADIGGMPRPIFETLVARGTLDPTRIRVIAYSTDIPQNPWVMRTDLDQALQVTIKRAFLDLDINDSEDASVLKPFEAEGFAAIDDSAYDVIRDIHQNIIQSR